VGYERQQGTALAMIARKGVAVALVRPAGSPAYNPLGGSGQTPGADTPYNVRALRLPANPSDFAPGSLEKRYVEQLLIAGADPGLPPGGIDQSDLWEFDTFRWTTARVAKLAPDGTPILWTVWVERGGRG
jgi:hypothetical protein